ncbi:hypothetical protein LBWT_50940 [Leptolyngbya boryana IAM M-101]|nr:hypothetical protein LBWT_50940 [Leptolyngbya boryana IAM M-101]BAS65473.1 hypothetical protein LBDG_50940 [Leptolyngbya boryana dg5]
MVGLICLFLGSCGFLVTASDCSGSIRAGVTSIMMSALAWGYLKQANEKPVGFWLNLYRTGVVIASAIVLFAIGRIIGALQGVGCAVG